MAETLGSKQRRFTQYVGLLIQFAYVRGFELTFGDTYRSPEQAQANAAAGSGIANSLHTQRLAVDFNLFIDGEYQTTSEAYEPLGVFWEGLAEDCCWGGRFKPRADGNHFSVTYNGVK
jgi:hypothetical protein